MAKLKKQSFLILGAVLILGVLILGQFGVLPFSIFAGVPINITGVTAVNQSGGSIGLISNDAEIASSRFRAAVTVGATGGDKINLSNISSLLGGDLTPGNYAEIGVASVGEGVYYTVGTTLNPVYKFDYRIVGSFTEVCPSGYTDYQWTTVNFQRFCVKKMQVGRKGYLNPPQVKYNIKPEIKIFNNLGIQIFSKVSNGFIGNCSTCTTTTTLRDSLGNYVAEVKYLGGTLNNPTYQYPRATETGLIPIVRDSDQSWHLAIDRWADYVASLGDTERELSAISTINESGLIAIIANVNNLANNLITEDKSIADQYPFARTVFAAIDGQQGFTLWLENALFEFPQLQFDVAADHFNIVSDIGKPVILDINPKGCIEIKTGLGETHTYTLRVKNDSGGQGTFNARLVGCGDLSGSIDFPLVLNAYATGNLYFNIVAGAQVQTYNCEIEVYQRDNTDRESICVELTETPTCFEGSYDVRGSNIYQCQNNVWVLIENCPGGIKYVNNVPECIIDPICVCGDLVCCGLETLLCPGDCKADKEICDNEIDDDADGMIDANDPDCKLSNKENCLLGISNECLPDGLFITSCKWKEPIAFGVIPGECQPLYNWPLIILAITAVGGLIGGVYVWKRYG